MLHNWWLRAQGNFLNDGNFIKHQNSIMHYFIKEDKVTKMGNSAKTAMKALMATGSGNGSAIRPGKGGKGGKGASGKSSSSSSQGGNSSTKASLKSKKEGDEQHDNPEDDDDDHMGGSDGDDGDLSIMVEDDMIGHERGKPYVPMHWRLGLFEKKLKDVIEHDICVEVQSSNEGEWLQVVPVAATPVNVIHSLMYKLQYWIKTGAAISLRCIVPRNKSPEQGSSAPPFCISKNVSMWTDDKVRHQNNSRKNLTQVVVLTRQGFQGTSPEFNITFPPMHNHQPRILKFVTELLKFEGDLMGMVLAMDEEPADVNTFLRRKKKILFDEFPKLMRSSLAGPLVWIVVDALVPRAFHDYCMVPGKKWVVQSYDLIEDFFTRDYRIEDWKVHAQRWGIQEDFDDGSNTWMTRNASLDINTNVEILSMREVLSKFFDSLAFCNIARMSDGFYDEATRVKPGCTVHEQMERMAFRITRMRNWDNEIEAEVAQYLMKSFFLTSTEERESGLISNAEGLKDLLSRATSSATKQGKLVTYPTCEPWLLEPQNLYISKEDAMKRRVDEMNKRNGIVAGPDGTLYYKDAGLDDMEMDGEKSTKNRRHKLCPVLVGINKGLVDPFPATVADKSPSQDQQPNSMTLAAYTSPFKGKDDAAMARKLAEHHEKTATGDRKNRKKVVPPVDAATLTAVMEEEAGQVDAREARRLKRAAASGNQDDSSPTAASSASDNK